MQMMKNANKLLLLFFFLVLVHLLRLRYSGHYQIVCEAVLAHDVAARSAVVPPVEYGELRAADHSAWRLAVWYPDQ